MTQHKLHFPVTNLIDFGTRKVNFGTKRGPKRPNENLALVLCCFIALIEPNLEHRLDPTQITQFPVTNLFDFGTRNVNFETKRGQKGQTKIVRASCPVFRVENPADPGVASPLGPGAWICDVP